MHNRLFYQIALTMIPSVGAVMAKQLISYCGSPEAVFSASRKNLLKIPGFGPKNINHIKADICFPKAEKEINFILKNDIQTAYYLDSNYPARIKPYNDAPILLYYKGKNVLNEHRNIAIIGTRKPTEYGKEMVKQIIEELKPYDITLVSGLAYGIDVSAHKIALENEIPNIAVLGHGLHTLYPAVHRKVAKRIIQDGLLLTEFSSQAKFDKENFPQRNRIIAGLADALIVAESGESGGSIITANFANDYSKDVFAVPGRINDPTSIGCNNLIKQHKAHLINSVKDISYIMRWDVLQQEKQIQRSLFNELNEDEQTIIHILADVNDLSIDEIMIKSNKTPSATANDLLQLEFKGLLKSLPGKRYKLIK